MGFEDWIGGQEPDGEDPGGVQCKLCGTDELTWEYFGQAEGWRLVTLGGKRHACPDGRPKPTNPITDFSDFLK
jgi:hypothetical protein